jgi:hypothetical protein
MTLNGIGAREVAVIPLPSGCGVESRDQPGAVVLELGIGWPSESGAKNIAQVSIRVGVDRTSVYSAMETILLARQLLWQKRRVALNDVEILDIMVSIVEIYHQLCFPLKPGQLASMVDNATGK